MIHKDADVFHAIADGNRRRLLDLLRDEERSVQELLPHFDVTLGAISQHLKVLHEAGLVVRRKQGRFRYYRVNHAGLREVDRWLEDYRRFWQSRLDRLERYLDGQP